MPEGAIQIRNDFGTDGYGGPCPPPRGEPHHYILTVYALDVDKIAGANDKTTAGVIAFNLQLHTKSKAELHWTYSR